MNRRLAQGYQGDAPQNESAETVAVVALGANLGDRAATISEALRDLARLPLTTEVRAAEPIESVALTPEGPDASAPAYLNTVALLTTRLAPSVLLGYLHAIEARHGRPARTADQSRWQDRTLDLDLIAYGDVQSTARRRTSTTTQLFPTRPNSRAPCPCSTAPSTRPLPRGRNPRGSPPHTAAAA
mgnify:CR=1 FL=1